MRKIILVSILLVGIFSCSDVVDPRPVIQGEVDGVLFRSADQAAFNSDGQLVIQGQSIDLLVLTLNNTNEGIYPITATSSTMASFVREGVTYTTAGTETDGMIEIEESTPTYITGNFYFEANRDGGDDRLNFTKGVFYRIPIVGGNVDVPGDGD